MISGQKADSFSAKLNQELSALDWKTKNELLLKIGKMELRMRASGIERPEWRGPIPEDKILGSDVVIPTDQGERRGRVICFGVVHTGGEKWEKSVIVHVPASGTQHEGPGSATRLATAEDVERIQGEMEMAARLVGAAEQAQKGAVAPSPEKARKRGQRDPELVKELHNLAMNHPNVKMVDEGGTNYKITGVDSNKRIYLFKNQLRADLSGFSVDHPGIRKITDDEARDMHLGKVRGQLLFEDRVSAKAAFEAALAQMKS